MSDDKADKPRPESPPPSPPPAPPGAPQGAETGYLDPDVLRAAEERRIAPGQLPRVVEFKRMPAGLSGPHEWRVVLVNSQFQFGPLALDICGDVFVGRAGMGIAPQLDLTEYDKPNFTVSRQHALLRPTEEGLLLLDMDSRNGTYVNGKRLASGEIHYLAPEDFIAFGKVRFVVTRAEKLEE